MIHLLDLNIKSDPQAEWHKRLAFAPLWHADQADRAKSDNQWFAVAFHLGNVADYRPWDKGARMQEANAWLKANQGGRAARAMLQATLLENHFKNFWPR